MNTNIINNSGAFKDLMDTLHAKSINRFNSIDEIINFKKNYNVEIENYKKKITLKIIEEINAINNEKNNLLNELNIQKDIQNTKIKNKIEQLNIILQHTNNNIFYKIRKFFAKRKIIHIESNFNKILEKPLIKYLNKINKLDERIDYLTNNQRDEVNIRSRTFVKEIEYIVSELNNLAPRIYGSVGELKAINLFKNLPDQYFIINDFRKSFNPPIYNRNEDDRIHSIQIDHLIIGPTGVYVVETKYWSQKSIESNVFFSPIKQLRRSGFAFFIIVNELTRRTKLFSEKRKILFFTSWKRTTISVSKILLMMHKSINEQFQDVKILTEYNFINYITKRPVIFNDEQIKYIIQNIV